MVPVIPIIAAWLIIGLPAQTKRPDFSGSWTLQSGVGGHGSTLLFSGKAMTIEQTTTSITVKRPQGQNTVSVTLPLDGREQTIEFPPLLRGRTEGQGAGTVKSTAAWHDNELVVTTTQEVVSQRSAEKGKREQKETLTLLEPGLLLVRRAYTEVGAASGGTLTEQDVYKLAPPAARKGGG